MPTNESDTVRWPGTVLRWTLGASFATASRLSKMWPAYRRLQRSLHLEQDISYAGRCAAAHHRLDIWRPRGPGPFPWIIYVHGGGFSLCSKQTHWHMAATLAAGGQCVALINYRLVPEHRYPAALEDVATAIAWCLEHRDRLGGAGQPALMGESAGANLVLAATLASRQQQPPGWAKPLANRALRPRALLLACGLLDTTQPERFAKRAPLARPIVHRRIAAICRQYVRGAEPSMLSWASPLLLLEETRRLVDWPPTWVAWGHNDPIGDDSRRLLHTLQTKLARAEVAQFSGGHAFFALPTHKEAAAFWQAALKFLRSHEFGSSVPAANSTP